MSGEGNVKDTFPDSKTARGFEHFSQPVLPYRKFLIRLSQHGMFSLALLCFSMAVGMLGYHAFAGLAWMDSFLNASMILTGMGPTNPMLSTGAKLFAGLYALYSGIAFLTAMGVLFAPVLHRVLHRFHLDK
jgi:hypothetical protein